MTRVLILVFYADLYKILRDLVFCNKKTRSFVRNGVLIACPCFPPAWLYGMKPNKALKNLSLNITISF